MNMAAAENGLDASESDEQPEATDQPEATERLARFQLVTDRANE